MANGGSKQTQKDKSGCSYTGKHILSWILKLDLSWLLDQSTIDFLLSNWGPFWARLDMESWLNKVSKFSKLTSNLQEFKQKKLLKLLKVLCLYRHQALFSLHLTVHIMVHRQLL